MKATVAWIVVVCCLIGAQERQDLDRQSLIAARKRHIEEQKKLHAEAVEKARQEVAVNPASAKSHLELAELLSRGTVDDETFQEIDKEYLKAIELNPNLAEAYLGLAKIRGSWSGPEGIEQLIEKAISVNSNYAEAYAALGTFYLGPILGKERGVDERKQARLAADAFKRAVQVKPNLGEAYSGLGLSLYALDQRREAIDVLKDAVLYIPADLLSRKLLGHLYVEAGDKNAAMEQYTALLNLGKECDLDLQAAEDFPGVNLPMVFAEELLKLIKKRFDQK
jgi:tetratricopeptide (TPR) repeat protein